MLSQCPAMKAQVSLCKCADLPEPFLLEYTKYGWRGRLGSKFRPICMFIYDFMYHRMFDCNNCSHTWFYMAYYKHGPTGVVSKTSRLEYGLKNPSDPCI